MNVCGDVISVALPLGIYHTRKDFFTAVQEAARDQHPKQLRLFGVKYSPTRPFVGPPSLPLLIPLLERIEHPLLERIEYPLLEHIEYPLLCPRRLA